VASERSSIVTRWPVLQEHRVSAEDLDANGGVRDEAVEGWAIAARSAYLARCPVLQEVQERSRLELQHRAVSSPSGAALVRPTIVVVTASAPEVRSRSFVIAVRIRPTGGNSHVTVDAAWVVRLVDPTTGEVQGIGDDIRDELIGLERSAQYFN
jgi:acyl-CoA thioesterase FadM